MKPRILIWGLGKDYNRYLNILKYWESQWEIEIIGVTDKYTPDLLEIDGWKIYQVDRIPKLLVDYYLVMPEKYFYEISNDIMALGEEKKKILHSKILDIPYFHWGKYLEIQKNCPSIICNNCAGGILYNALGLECKSPCKNLAIPDNDFLKMILNLKLYMSLELEFKRYQVDPHSKQEFPVMKLDDIEIWCNHDIYADEAKCKWDRRKQKINYENIMLMFYTENDEYGEKFLEIADCKKILFVPEKSNLDGSNVFHLRLFPGQKEFWQVVNSSVSLGKNSYSYQILDMLNGTKKYRYLGKDTE